MTNMKKTLILTVLINSIVFVGSGYSQSATSSALNDVSLKHVALFKNGLGFFICEVTCPDKADSFRITPPGAASHGSFWVSYPPKVKLESLVAKEIESEQIQDVISIPELLKANVGRAVQLYLSGKDEQMHEGVIKYFAEDRQQPTPDPYGPGREIHQNRNYGRQPDQGSLMIFQTDDGEVAINPSNVRRVEFPGRPRTTLTNKTKSTQFEVTMSAPAKGQKLNLYYLAKGITWAPSYMVDITDGENANLSAKTVVINEVCDLDDVTVSLVTGYPNLQFADIVSPLAMKENLAGFLQALTRGQSAKDSSRGIMSNVMRQEVGYRKGSSSPMPAYGSAETGKVAEDLFFYPTNKVQMKKGEIAYLPLFTEKVPYKHIYKWDIPDYVNYEDRYSYFRGRGQQDGPKEEVWHCLRMENNTKVPWTTAPAEIIKEGLILGQDTLNYCPVEGKTTLRITQAVGVKAEQLELEVERQRDAARLYGYHYDLVTVEGKLSVTNFQQKDITLEITKTLSGELKVSEPSAKVEKLARGLQRMNGVMNLTWTIELKPGEQKQLGYTYAVFVRR